MNTNERSQRDRHTDQAVDELIRRRFRSCESLPLFPDTRPLPAGFFEFPATGTQLRFPDAREFAAEALLE